MCDRVDLRMPWKKERKGRVCSYVLMLPGKDVDCHYSLVSLSLLLRDDMKLIEVKTCVTGSICECHGKGKGKGKFVHMYWCYKEMLTALCFTFT